jgi:ABC-type transporter lipoprotein component MlaA
MILNRQVQQQQQQQQQEEEEAVMQWERKLYEIDCISGLRNMLLQPIINLFSYNTLDIYL